MNKHLKIAAALLVALPTLTFAQVRTEQTFEKGWKFTREDSKDFSQQTYDDTKWQSVTVPHDWAIYGPFSIENDKQKVAITQDGQKEALEHAGRTGGLPFVGVGWYRLNFEAPAFSSGKKATLIFDGAMSHARVYINGQEAGFWPYGYNSFHIDATPYLKAGEQNTLAVRLENETESSRWYPGAGLYRNVHLVINEDALLFVGSYHFAVGSFQFGHDAIVGERLARRDVETCFQVDFGEILLYDRRGELRPPCRDMGVFVNHQMNVAVQACARIPA